MARIRVKKKEKPVRIPPCLLRDHPIFLSEFVRQEWIKTYEHAVRTGNEPLAQKVVNEFVSPRNRVAGYRRLEKYKVRIPDVGETTTGQYTRGKTHPRYLGMDVK